MQKIGSSSSFTSQANNSAVNNNLSNSAEIQAQFELLVELRKFLNIDLFQRGYYQVRVAARCGNKQMPVKIILQLENNSNNTNLSESMFPSSVVDDWAVSKTFLILYRNEEVILDDQILFKISTLVNAFNMVESFEKLELMLSVELWFTENDYKPLQQSTSSLNSSSNSFSNLATQPASGQTNTSSMQMLCTRLFKVHFDPRLGIHLQVPVLFDYFHLSAVLLTIHCTLLTLLPPVMLGTNSQRTSTLSSILFGKDLSKYKSMNEVNANLMKRAVHLHNQICGLLLAAYDHLQEHIEKMSSHLNEFQRKKLRAECSTIIDCHEKLRKISEIAQACSDPETLDDIANRHVAQCSAENIMQWCTYIEHFSLNEQIAPFLAGDYHSKRLKRFSECFFIRDVPRKNLHEFELSDNYVGLNDLIRQSAYYTQLPELVVACDELDGSPDTIPVIFEDNCVCAANTPNASSPSPLLSPSDSIQTKPGFIRAASQNSAHSSMTSSQAVTHLLQNNKESFASSQPQQSQRKSSVSSNENSNSSNSAQWTSSGPVEGSRSLQKKLKKKVLTGDSLDVGESSKSITLVSYRKIQNEHFSDLAGGGSVGIAGVESIEALSGSGSASGAATPDAPDTQSKLNLIKAELASRVSTPNSNRLFNKSFQLESKLVTASATDLFKRNFSLQGHPVLNKQQSSSSNEDGGETDVKRPQTYQSLNNLTANNNNKNSSLPSGLSEFGSPRLKGSNSESISPSGVEILASSSVVLDLNEISIGFQNDEATVANNAALLSLNEKPARPSSISPLDRSDEDTVAPATPSDGSFKSRALYESFRGKPSTLERPRRKRPSVNSMGSATSGNPGGSVSSWEEVTGQRKWSSSESEVAGRYKLESRFKDESYVIIENEPREEQSRPEFRKQLTLNPEKSAILSESVFKFVLAKEELKRAIAPKFQGNIYSEFSSLFCSAPYFYPELTPKLSPTSSFEAVNPADSSRHQHNGDDSVEEDDEKLHLVVCVHGLDGNSGDLRLVRTYLELALPGAKMDFLMSEHNQENTFDDIEVMTLQLIKEINDYVDMFGINPHRISFIGHSLGNLIVRSTVAHEQFKPFVSRLYTYLSLSGPHLGTLYNSSGLINMGMWIMQKWKKSGSLLQLSLKDHSDLHKTFLYKLSTKPTFEYFKHVLLVASPQDRYVPFHSARIEMCKAALKDGLYGQVYREMMSNILRPIQANSGITFKRYSAFHCLPSGTNNFIGRAAHIAVLDSELFVEKLILVSVSKYFR